MTTNEDRPALARRLDLLFRQARPDGRRWTNDEVARELKARHPSLRVTGAYLSALRTGRRTEPSSALLQALAAFFGVSPAYFVDEAHAERVAAQLAALEALKETGVRGVALRAAGLPQASLDTIVAVLDQIRRTHGLPPVPAD
ncbi:hypothetical protein GCM10010124_03100 [Pilimelia terevasa]|uniref:HTH cro/C1-type domain-containing protein n=1 Tax=Pilimelia terevasa TaxID=53372 RepID=A0A8J3BDQ1_9ACTN|nr:helix-turn-helix transcriptional regulator [Pilimelia terevasa]GGK13913.1 hypothetical protein GCM10010124_03100 [Pilimelia terevasa]